MTQYILCPSSSFEQVRKQADEYDEEPADYDDRYPQILAPSPEGYGDAGRADYRHHHAADNFTVSMVMPQEQVQETTDEQHDAQAQQQVRPEVRPADQVAPVPDEAR
jgi:hypothetical protein